MKKHLNFIENHINNNYWTNWLGLARTLIALSTFLTIIFNKYESIYYTGILNEKSLINEKTTLSIYTWFPDIIYGYWITIVVLIITIIGIYPRFTSVLHWLVTYSFFHSSTISDGGDHIATLLTFLLIPICIFDKRKTHWSTKSYTHSFYAKSISTIFYELIRLQVFIIYFFASVGKFSHKEWQEGTALYYWFSEPLFGLNNWLYQIFEPLIKSPLILTLSTWFVLVIELTFAFSYFLKNKKIKLYVFYLGIFFHFFIAICFGLITFFLVMISALILFLISKNNNYEFRTYNINTITMPFNNLLSISSKKN
jgi:antimicrobial peptide system SdpB family protein